MHFPKIPLGPIHPFTKPLLFPIWKRLPLIALTMCRYSLPRTLQSTMSPTESVEESTGATVQSWPDSILPFIDEPRGRNDTVSPACSF